MSLSFWALQDSSEFLFSPPKNLFFRLFLDMTTRPAIPTSTSSQTVITITPTPTIETSSHVGKSTTQTVLPSEENLSKTFSLPYQFSSNNISNVTTNSETSTKIVSNTIAFSNLTSPTEKVMVNSGFFKGLLAGIALFYCSTP